MSTNKQEIEDAEIEDTETYHIVRYYSPAVGKESHDVEGLRGLSLEEARAHCSNPETHQKGVYFDGYQKD